MQTRVIVSYLHFDVDAHLLPSHTCCVIYLQLHDRRKLAMLTTCRLETVSHLCYLPAVARPSQTCYANYMQEHDRLTLVMLPTRRRVTVSHICYATYMQASDRHTRLLCYLRTGEWPSLTFVMLLTCRRVTVSNFLCYLYADSRAYFPTSFKSYAMFIFR